jgi:hypothetical protein
MLDFLLKTCSQAKIIKNWYFYSLSPLVENACRPVYAMSSMGKTRKAFKIAIG